jgi:outer membrane immunogenic protein
MNYRLKGAAAACAAAAGTAALMAAAPALAQQSDNTWGGWYVGATAGIGWGHTHSHLHLENGAGSTIIPPADVASLNSKIANNSDHHSGFVGALEGGYNYMMGNILLGVETDFGFYNIKETRDAAYQSPLLISPPITYTLHQKVHTDWMWTLRPRIGYASGPWLFFGSAGIAVSDLKIETSYHDNLTPPGNASFSDSSTKTGFAGGLGVAYSFSPNWSVKGEWLYTDLGKVSASTATPNNTAVITADGKISANLLRIGVDYKF